MAIPENTTPNNSVRLSAVSAAALLFMLGGLALELVLLEHYEDVKQLIPMICIGAALLLTGGIRFKRSELMLRAYKVVLILTALSGAYGTYLHLQANFEFEQEMTPTAGTGELILESLSGALPALAPGSMIALALLGYTYLLILQNQSQ